MDKKYIITRPIINRPKGTFCYVCVHPDYGVSKENTIVTGSKHISMTESPSGDYPFFSIPKHFISEVVE